MKIKKWMVECIWILIMLGLFLILNKEQKIVNAQEVDYLKNNYRLTLQLDDTDLTTSKAFVVSELHGFKQNTLIKYDYLTYLNEEINLTVYLAEISFSSGYLLNEYLKTGDEALLMQVFSFYKGSTFYTLEEYQFYQKIYQYNLNISEESKIRVIGIDIEHSLESARYFLEYYCIDEVLIEDIENNDYEDSLLNHLKNNLLAYHSFYKNFNWQERDFEMYQNYLFLQSFYQFDNFYTQLGAKHGFSDIATDNFQSFTYYLNHDICSPVFNHVLSVMMFYKDSEYLEVYYIKSVLIHRNGKVKRTYKTNNLDVFTQDIVLINLGQNNSPFNERLIWYNESENNCEKVTTDYYQYLLLINQSEAASPIDENMKPNYFDTIIQIIKNLF